MATVIRLLKPQFSSLMKRSLSTNTSIVSELESQRSVSTDPPPPFTDDPKDSRSFHWVFLGCPGVGKGTYASRLSALLGVPHIATGDLVRQELSSSGPLSRQLDEVVNQGNLVSDEIIFNLLSKRLEASESRGESGFILDGFPRTIRQAEILDEVTEIDLVVNLKLREDALIHKCLGRRVCSECGKGFNLAFINLKAENGLPAMSMPPLLPPQHCASKLITRADDTEPVVKERLRVYKEQVKKLKKKVIKRKVRVETGWVDPEQSYIKMIRRFCELRKRGQALEQPTQPVEDYYRKQGKLMEFDLPGGIPESWPKLLELLNLDDYHPHKKSASG